MIQNIKLAKQIAVVSGIMGALASCTTAKVYSVVPPAKPSTEEIAMLTQLQQTDTTALAPANADPNATAAALQTSPMGMAPVDMATDKSVAMAYAIPSAKPASEAAAAIGQIQIASADPAMGQEAMANAAIVQATTNQPQVMQDSFGQPEYSASAALVETQPKTRSIDPFVTSTKNSDLNQMITRYAALYDVPETLVHHVVRRESNYNPNAVHRGNWGLMQIRYNTAKSLGYDGSPSGLLDAETNLKYAVKYLRGAWVVAEKDAKKADWLYRTGYYYQAKKKRLLGELGMN
jgi:soluble lytic murein transglycosylase-like protein